jgi:hypothetical protein
MSETFVIVSGMLKPMLNKREVVVVVADALIVTW